MCLCIAGGSHDHLCVQTAKLSVGPVLVCAAQAHTSAGVLHPAPHNCLQTSELPGRSDAGVRYAFLCYVRAGAAADLPPALAAQHEERQVAPFPLLAQPDTKP